MNPFDLDPDADDYSDNETELHATADENLVADTDHGYMCPFTIGNIAIKTCQEFIQESDNIYSELVKLAGESKAASLWSDFYGDLTDLSDTENMDLASRDFVMVISLFSSTPQQSAPSLETKDIDLKSLDINLKHELSEAVAEFDLDDPRLYGQGTFFSLPKAATNRVIKLSHGFRVPPLAPVCPARAPSLMVFKSQPETLDLVPTVLNGPFRVHWSDHIETQLGMASGSLPAATYDSSLTAGSRSNTRPAYEPAVYLMWEDGSELNIGIHGYTISKDLTFALDFSGMEQALQELFAAPGGEGLTDPTPSHILHQIVSSCLSAALETYQDVVVEKDNVDILCNGHAIDITSSASIWKKPLRPTNANPHHRTQAAVSKYDIAASLAAFADPAMATIILQAVANCLATEYPGAWHHRYSDVPKDLQLQEEIYTNLANLGQSDIEVLSEACYEAAVIESLSHLKDFQLTSQGAKFKDKRNKLLAAVKKLRPRNKIAFPPIPLSEIGEGFSSAFSIQVLGHDFTAGAYSIEGKACGPRYVMDECPTFLEKFPANGLVSHAEAQELASLYDRHHISSRGKGNPGPCPDAGGSDPRLVDACNAAYSQNAFAQLCEIQADVVRSINALPFPAINTWQQVYVYQGRVSVWYRSRDSAVSPEGYRIDWFALSRFEVCGSLKVELSDGSYGYLWPRQRLKSQEMDLRSMGPRRLKYALYTILEKCRSTRTTYEQACLAWNRLAITCATSTWASGELFKTCRYLSASLSSPSSPFDTMSEKLKRPVAFCDVLYLHRLTTILETWTSRDKYHSECAILGLPRAYAQLESYWMLWVPDEYADSDKHMASCAMDLYDEYRLVESSAGDRTRDLQAQLLLSQQKVFTVSELRSSIRASCSLDTKGKLGWSWVGSLASAHSLRTISDPAEFDRRYGKGIAHRTLAHHMTVRHSARIKPDNSLEKGTVAEMIINSGVDPLISKVTPTFRFLFGNRPVFFNHPKKGEHKDREISITDPDSRIALNSAELACGQYGRTTGVDYLKVANKDQVFYKASSLALKRGGVIQSSDASRYGPMMSNFAIAIMLLMLGSQSMHLRWSAVVYGRLAYRLMTLTRGILPKLAGLCVHPDTSKRASGTFNWINAMPRLYHEDGVHAGWYCTSVHMGQGMSHHSSSLLHAGGLIVSQDAVLKCDIQVNGKPVRIVPKTMVTSDDSTLIPSAYSSSTDYHLTRREKQTACHIFLRLQRETRKTALRMVSVMPNLPKEVIAGTKGEFNSQDTGIGLSCPILGFREGIALLVPPSSSSLIGDYLNAHAHAKTVGFLGQGMECGNYFHALAIDAIEQRWYLNRAERRVLEENVLIPNQLICPASGTELASSPASWLAPSCRAFLLDQSMTKNSISEDLDPHTKDAVFSPLMHIKISMSKQHRRAITSIKTLIKELQTRNNSAGVQLMEEVLSQTLSSARTRNLGRVAARIKTRKITPRQWITETFESETVIQHTLSWLQYLQNKFLSTDIGHADILAGNSIAGTIKFSPPSPYLYPLPPLRRTFNPAPERKPKFRTENYGLTPFGRHAVERSRTTIVKALTQSERRLMQMYLARRSYRRFTEHITYGDTFVTSWHRGTGQTIVALDITSDVDRQMVDYIKWGSFSPIAIDRLRKWQASRPRVPLLALHRYVDGRGLWHAIHNGLPITVVRRLDLDTLSSNTIETTDDHGMPVILAMQGFADEYKWEGSGPKSEEIEHYLMMDPMESAPKIVRHTEKENMMAGSTQIPTYSTSLVIDGVNTFISVAPEIYTTPYDNPEFQTRMRYFRSKVIAELATAGYWHSSLRGTAFRAYVRGHWYDETIWVGSVIGWKMSSTSIPSYGTTWHQTTAVQALYALNQISNAELLSPFNPNLFGSGIRVVAGSKTLCYDAAVRVSSSFIPIILAKNRGRRHEITEIQPGFLDLRQGPPEYSPQPIDPHSAITVLESMLKGQVLSSLGW
jgi:hypothetical protein